MPLNPAFVGRAFPLDRPYVVGEEKIREFVAAIGDEPFVGGGAGDRRAVSNDDLGGSGMTSGKNFRDEDGTSGLFAPPTFAIAVLAGAQDAVLFDPALGLDFSRVVHRDQRFTHHRPIRAGDRLSATVHIDGVRVLAGNDVLTLRTELIDSEGQAVCTAVGTLVSRAA